MDDLSEQFRAVQSAANERRQARLNRLSGLMAVGRKPESDPPLAEIQAPTRPNAPGGGSEMIMNVQAAIELAIAENRCVHFECDDSNEKIMSSVEDLKGCHLMKPKPDATTITVWPPSECRDHLDSGQPVRLPWPFVGER